MAFMFLFNNHVQNVDQIVNEEELITQHRINRKRLRDACDPFEVPDSCFRQNFRLSKDCVRGLIQRLSPHLVTQHARANGLTPTHKVLASLIFLAHGSYQRGCVAEHDLLYMCQASVSNSLHEFLNAMDAEIVPAVIKFPQTEEARDAVKLGFYTKFGFPGCIGALDCTLVRIVRPHLNEEQFWSHKGYHCMNVQLVCDSNLMILAVNPRHGGRTHDAFIWRFSTLQQELRRVVTVEGEEYCWLIGDSGYPLQPWLLVPIVGADPDSPEGRYTAAHILARNCVERVNGVIKNKWRCILGARALHYDPDTVRQIIRTVCALHNIGMMAVPEFLNEHMDFIIPPNIHVNANPVIEAAIGETVLQEVIENHFS
nr:PREDICTED: putative nuclease HARBI1 [Bemisia tabaci]